MKVIRSNRPVTLLQLGSPLFISFLLINFSSAVMAKESPKTVKSKQKVSKEQLNIALKPIVVTGKSDQQLAAASAEVDLSPGGVSLVNIEELHDRNVSSIADFFRYVPGVWAASQSGNDEVFFSSRGSNLDSTNFDQNGIKFLQDGLPVTAADGNNHNRMIDPLAASFATVARGGNALKYGASTLGGAVDFTSPSAHTSPAMRLSLSGGSFGQFLGRGTVSSGSRYFCESFFGHPCPTSSKKHTTANACGCPSRPASLVRHPTRGDSHHPNDSTRFRKACIFTPHKTLRKNTCTIASGDYSTPVSQRLMRC
ncbi:MAG: TonB-dependent receptor plug domain-containing protein [Methylobacter sp.]